MTGAGLVALASYWRRNPLQLFALVAGLALATALWSGVQAINSEARASYDAAAAILGEGQYDQLVPRNGETIPQDTYVALRRAGWLVSPVLEGEIVADGSRVRIVGVDPLTAPGGMGPTTLEAQADLPAFLTQGVLFADAAIAAALAQVTRYPVQPDAGVAPGTALADIAVAQALLDRQDRLTRLILAPEQPLGRAPLDSVAPGLIRQASQQTSDIGRLTDSFHLNLTAFGLLSFAVGIFIVHGAIGLAFEQRRAMVRTLRALGMPLRRVVAILFLELAVIGLLAGAIGVLLGYVIAAALLPDVAATLEGLYGARISGVLHLRPVWWATGLAIAVCGAGLAATGALWRIARMPVLSSAGGRAWAIESGRSRWVQGTAALGLLALAGLLVPLGEGLIMGFACLACLLLGAALGLPLVLNALLAVAQRFATAPVTEWFLADTRQQLPGLSLALMALLLAAAANIGVSTMVSSFRLTFVGFLDQRLSAELYVSIDSPAQSAEFEAFVAPRTTEVLPILSVETRLNNLPADLYGARIGATHRQNWTFLAQSPQVWDRVARGEAVIINEQLARRADIWVGDRLELGSGLTLSIAGIFGDYGNPIGQAIIAEDLFQTLHPELSATRFGLRSADPEGLRQALIAEFGLSPGQMIDQAGLKAFSLSVFERTFTVTGALNVLTLSVAGFAMLMSLLTLAELRVPQLAPAWALGITRRRLGRLEIARAAILALLTLAVALPLGLALAWILLAVVNVEAFGWRLPMFLFPAYYARLGLLTLVAALLAALWPARRLATKPPAALLKVFANER